jgi:uncharacterized RDD family membrane protein YckC
MELAGILEWSIFSLLIIGLIVFLLPVIAIIDIIRRYMSGIEKLVWIVIVVIIPILGSILYFLIGRNRKRQRPGLRD